jgi:ParB/RepB/Spo0J family partition protein
MPQPNKNKLITLSMDELYISEEISKRKTTDYLDNKQHIERLAGSIQDHGLLTPILVVRIADSVTTNHKPYCLVSGFYRIFALIHLAETTGKRKWLSGIPARVIQHSTNTALVQLIESTPRIKLSPIDEANAIRSALDLSCTICSESEQLTTKSIAKAIGMPEGWVHIRLKLLRFPVEIQDMLHTSKLTMTHAQFLMKYVPESNWLELARKGCSMDVAMFVHLVRSMYDDSYPVDR